MDKTSLENAIKQECEQNIKTIREGEAQEIRRIDIRCLAETDGIRRLATEETDAQIRLEITRMENKDGLERRKLQLQSLEQFINRLVDDVMAGMRRHPQYRQFVLGAASAALSQISGRAEVRLSSGDMDMARDIRAGTGSNSFTVAGDPSIRRGGCLVMDESGGRIFNSTLERIYFRKSSAIRRKVAAVLAEQEREKPIK